MAAIAMVLTADRVENRFEAEIDIVVCLIQEMTVQGHGILSAQP